MQRVIKLRNWFAQSRKNRILFLAVIGCMAGIGAGYLYFHNPLKYPLPCLFHVITGLYCPGCGAGRASYNILHGNFLTAFCYNPVMVFLLPFLGIYFVTVAADWALTGKNHVDKKINPKILIGILVFLLIFGVIRNLPFYPFRLLVPGGPGRSSYVKLNEKDKKYFEAIRSTFFALKKALRKFSKEIL